MHRERRRITREEAKRREGGVVVSQTTNDEALKRSDSTCGDNKLYIYVCVKTKEGQRGLCVKGRSMEARGRGRRKKLIGVCVCVYEEGYEIRNLMAEGEVDFIFVVACGVVTVAGPNVFDTTSTV